VLSQHTLGEVSSKRARNVALFVTRVVVEDVEDECDLDELVASALGTKIAEKSVEFEQFAALVRELLPLSSHACTFLRYSLHRNIDSLTERIEREADFSDGDLADGERSPALIPDCSDDEA